MSSIRNKGTNPEIRLRKALFGLGYRYKINDKTLPGSPDIVLPKYNSVIFVHGCFWHGHSTCNKTIKPKSNVEFWNTKVQKNILRDKIVMNELRKMKWNILTVWGCELNNKKSYTAKIKQINYNLQAHCQSPASRC